MTTNLIVKLVWVIATAWAPTPPPSVINVPAIPGWITTTPPCYSETGTISSNLVMRFDWKGEKKEVTLQSIDFMQTNRTWKEEKVYTPGSSQPILRFELGPYVATNYLYICTNGWDNNNNLWFTPPVGTNQTILLHH